MFELAQVRLRQGFVSVCALNRHHHDAFPRCETATHAGSAVVAQNCRIAPAQATDGSRAAAWSSTHACVEHGFATRGDVVDVLNGHQLLPPALPITDVDVCFPGWRRAYTKLAARTNDVWLAPDRGSRTATA